MNAVKALTAAAALLLIAGAAQAAEPEGFGCALKPIEQWNLGDIKLCGALYENPANRYCPNCWSDPEPPGKYGITRADYEKGFDDAVRRLEARKAQLRATRSGSREIPLCVGNCR
jgi:hypothetical protein